MLFSLFWGRPICDVRVVTLPFLPGAPRLAVILCRRSVQSSPSNRRTVFRMRGNFFGTELGVFSPLFFLKSFVVFFSSHGVFSGVEARENMGSGGQSPLTSPYLYALCWDGTPFFFFFVFSRSFPRNNGAVLATFSSVIFLPFPLFFVSNSRPPLFGHIRPWRIVFF